jgi:hypothetical protein
MKKIIILITIIFIIFACNKNNQGGGGDIFSPVVSTNEYTMLSIEYAGNWSGQYDLNDNVITVSGYNDWYVTGENDGKYVELNITKGDITSSLLYAKIEIINAYSDGSVINTLIQEGSNSAPGGNVTINNN